MTKEYFDKLPNGYHLMSCKNSNMILIKKNNMLVKKYVIKNGSYISIYNGTQWKFVEEYENIIIENKITNKLNRIFRLEQLQEKINEL
jgi:hypothetical protein